MSAAWAMGGLVFTVVLAAIAWAVAWWDIERRKVKLEEHAYSTLKGDVATHTSRINGVYEQIGKLREDLGRASEKTTKVCDELETRADRIDQRIDSATGYVEKLDDALERREKHASEMYTALGGRITTLEDAMRDMGNPKPKREALKANISPFGRHNG